MSGRRLGRWGALGLALVSAIAPLAARAFVLDLTDADFATAPTFSNVQEFEFSIDLAGAVVPGRIYRNADLVEVQYVVGGPLSLSPPTPSGFAAFLLDRTPAREGPIDPLNWEAQGSFLDFEVSATANLADGLQLAELVPDLDGVILRVDAREFERLDRARYHPPLLVLFEDGKGTLVNSNNSSGRTGTLNPATLEPVAVDFGEEYATDLAFDPAGVTIVPEPTAAVASATALAALLTLAPRRSRDARRLRASPRYVAHESSFRRT